MLVESISKVMILMDPNDLDGSTGRTALTHVSCMMDIFHWHLALCIWGSYHEEIVIVVDCPFDVHCTLYI